MGWILREDGLVPQTVGAEIILSAVQGVELPAAGRRVIVKLAILVARERGPVEAQAGRYGSRGPELAEARPFGDQPDMAVGEIGHNPLSVLVGPVEPQRRFPCGTAGKAGTARAARPVSQVGSRP